MEGVLVFKGKGVRVLRRRISRLGQRSGISWVGVIGSWWAWEEDSLKSVWTALVLCLVFGGGIWCLGSGGLCLRVRDWEVFGLCFMIYGL